MELELIQNEQFKVRKTQYQGDTWFVGRDVAEAMISKGAAFDWGGKYYKAQAYAQENALGVWSDTKFQERPWFFRRRMALEHGPAL